MKQTRKPQWVSDWAWGEYLHAYDTAVKNSGGYSGDTEMEVMEAIGKVVMNSACKAFWRAIDRRHEECDERNHGYEEGSTDGRLVIVLYELGEAALGIQPQNRLTVTERKRKGIAIAKAAVRLKVALDDICVDGCFPGWFYDGLDRPQSDDDDEGETEDYRAGRDAALFDYVRTLRAFEAAGRTLANSTPDVPQPMAPTANKTRFIRFATSTMRTHYGTPLRDAVAALARALFDCEIDAAGVAKLAP